MKKSEIKVRGRYIAKVSGKLVTVRVDQIGNAPFGDGVRYDVTNLATKRKTTFRSAAKFRREVSYTSDDLGKAIAKAIVKAGATPVTIPPQLNQGAN